MAGFNEGCRSSAPAQAHDLDIGGASCRYVAEHGCSGISGGDLVGRSGALACSGISSAELYIAVAQFYRSCVIECYIVETAGNLIAAVGLVTCNELERPVGLALAIARGIDIGKIAYSKGFERSRGIYGTCAEKAVVYIDGQGGYDLACREGDHYLLVSEAVDVLQCIAAGRCSAVQIGVIEVSAAAEPCEIVCLVKPVCKA